MTLGGDIALVKAERCFRLIGSAALNQESFAGSAQYTTYIYSICYVYFECKCIKLDISRKKVHVVRLSNCLLPLFNVKLSWKWKVQCLSTNVSIYGSSPPTTTEVDHAQSNSWFSSWDQHIPLEEWDVPLINGPHTRTRSVMMQVINMCFSYCDFVLFYTVPLVKHTHKHARTRTHTSNRNNFLKIYKIETDGYILNWSHSAFVLHTLLF